MTHIRKEIVCYVEQNVIPQYAHFDAAHRENHATEVITRAIKLYETAPVEIKEQINPEILYVAAACHDLGLVNGRENHHLDSGKIIRADKRLAVWFTPAEIEIIAQAAEDHRASSKSVPRSTYGKIVAEADRLIICETIIERTILFGFDHYPEKSREEHIQRAIDHLEEKYGRNGYLHLYIYWSDNAAELEKLRKIIDNKSTLYTTVSSLFDRLSSQQK